MQHPSSSDAVRILDEIMQVELAGVVRYTHYAIMITGPNRMPLVEFMKAQAAESLAHAQAAGEILAGLDEAITQLLVQPQDELRVLLLFLFLRHVRWQLPGRYATPRGRVKRSSGGLSWLSSHAVPILLL